MLKIRFALLATTLILAAHAYSQCKECKVISGACTGVLGDSCAGNPDGCVLQKADLVRDFRLRGEWRLVAVEVKRPRLEVRQPSSVPAS